MNNKCTFKEAIFPQFNITKSYHWAIFLPMILVVCSLSCGGGAKSISTTDKAGEGVSTPPEEVHISEFILGPGDELAVRVWGHSDLSKKVTLDLTGEFYYPFVGYVKAGGMGIKEVRQLINEGLSRYYVNPQVGVEVVSLRSQKIFVLGEVSKPGIFVLDGSKTAIEAISKAGGFTREANKSSVVLIRGDFDNPELMRLNLEDFLMKGATGENKVLVAGDVIYVPKSFVADLRTFFRTMQNIMRPIVLLERAIILEPRAEDVFLGEE